MFAAPPGAGPGFPSPFIGPPSSLRSIAMMIMEMAIIDVMILEMMSMEMRILEMMIMERTILEMMILAMMVMDMMILAMMIIETMSMHLMMMIMIVMMMMVMMRMVMGAHSLALPALPAAVVGSFGPSLLALPLRSLAGGVRCAVRVHPTAGNLRPSVC